MRPSPRRVLVVTLASALTCVLACAPFAVHTARGQDREAGPRDEAEVVSDEETDEELDQDVDTDVRTEGGEKVKVFRFSGLDVSGRLKSPQLLYFLNRMRAEFDRPRLPHRFGVALALAAQTIGDDALHRRVHVQIEEAIPQARLERELGVFG